MGNFSKMFSFRVKNSIYCFLYFFFLCFDFCVCEDKNQTETIRLNSVTGFSVTAPPKDVPSKRDAKVQDLSSSATAKSYDPPPEFYRGPGSLPSPINSNYNKPKDSTTSGFISKPITITELTGHTGHSGSSIDSLSNEYNKWQANRNNYGIYNGIQDRISVGHYGSSSSGHSGSSGLSSHAGTSYASGYDARPSGYDYAAHSSGHGHYQPHYGGGYYAGSSSAESIPFDVYGTKGHGYAGAGGEYSYTYPYEHSHEIATHKGPPGYSSKALLAKSFLIPLASAAVLGIAAALVSNPLLLQLGTVSGLGPTVVGKRKRRDIHGTSNLRKRYTKIYENRNHETQPLQAAYHGHAIDDV